LKHSFNAVLLAVWLGLLLGGDCAQPPAAEASGESSDLSLKEMLSEGLGYPPYRIAISVEGVHGLQRAGAQDLLEGCLKEDLKGLGDVEQVDVQGAGKPPAVLRITVRFTETLRPEGYECYDITMVAVVGKINKENPQYEAILDTYALAGIAETDLSDMCQKIVIRFDMKILSALRKMRQSSQKVKSR
jgi:hypothetical protein